MATTIISACLPPNIDPTKAHIAFQDRALPKLNEQLCGDDLTIKQCALMSLCDLLHNPEYIQQAITCSVIPTLLVLLCDVDITVRMKTSEAFLLISGHAIGRQVIIEQNVINPLSLLFNDECYTTRLNVYHTIERLALGAPGTESVVGCGLMPLLIANLETDTDEIKVIILLTLNHCMRVNFVEALHSNAMLVCKSLLSHFNFSIRTYAAMAIKELSLTTDGKNQACDEGCIPLLVKLLKDEEVSVRAQSCAALSAITITTRGKRETLKFNVIPTVLQLLLDLNVEIRLNALKLISNLSEAPEGRKELLESVDYVSSLKSDYDSAAVRKAAQIAEKMILWKP
ncbi:radial spoke head 14 homolog [Hydra vulgaris]|uniref:Rhabdoid tumor deletion region protein 1 n=1 Tax=Hydra vulgaris TaxID=6087 RepID=T2M477_HYDVU|nr:radial spoke head 14 homolog [Hydra vulgaris]